MRLNKFAVALLCASFAVSGCAKLGIGGGDKAKSRTPVLGNRIDVLSSESGVDVEASLAGVSVLLPPAQINASWEQPGGNASKSMDHLAIGQSLGKVWSTRIAGTTKTQRLGAAPIVAEGKIFAVDVGAVLHAFDSTSGAKLWSVQLGNGEADKAERRSLFGGGVSYENGILYATTGLGDVEARAAGDGKRIWKVRPSGPLRGAPGVALGNVFVMTQDNQLITLSASDGSVVWTEAASVELAGVFGTAAPAIAQGTVVAGFSSGELNAYRYENGRALWGDALSRTSISTSVAALADVDANPVIDRGRVFAIGQGGRMVSMELVTGQRLWEINVAGISTPWVSGEWLFVIDDQARLLCIARASGKVRWISQLPRWGKAKSKKNPISWTGPLLAGDRLILASSRGDLINVSPLEGAIQTTTRVGAGVTLSPIIANNTLYILDDDGHLTAWR